MTKWRWKTPHLFTGAFFPEEICRGLIVFASRYKLESNVWVPKRLVKGLKEGITLLPNAILCDVLLIPGCAVTDLAALGHDRILVNAAHTTDVEFFEDYKGNIAAGLHGSFPLSSVGAPFGESRVKALKLIAGKACFRSPYWVGEGCSSRRLINAEQTPFQGRYNPSDCVLYEPHSLTNQPFPRPISILMRRKALRCGYVSRTWVTMAEGASFGVNVSREGMRDYPPILTSYFSGKGGAHAVEYFCADQFENADVFPTKKEIDLAVGGVTIGEMKVSGFPFLSSLAREPVSTVRHRCLAEEVAKLSLPVLFSLSRMATVHCTNREFQKALQRFALLRGYANPYFVLHTDEVGGVVRLKPREQGITFATPGIHDTHCGMQSSSCFFNVEQFEDPLHLEEMIMKTPTMFLNQAPVFGISCAWECVRAQCAKKTLSRMWIPATFLDYLSDRWTLSPDAFRVEHMYSASGRPFVIYNMSDVKVPAEALKWWPSYIPHDILNKPYSGTLKSLLTLRAWERRYTSALWVPQELVAQHGATVRSRRRCKGYLRGCPFEDEKGVVFGGGLFVNIEEVENADWFFTTLRSDRVTACGIGV